MKKGRRTYGAIYTRSDGKQFYLAWRRRKDIFRDAEPTVSDAVKSGKAIWALDKETLLMLRRKGVRVIGVLEHESEDFYWTSIHRFLDSTLAKPRDYRRRGGEDQRYLPFHQFHRSIVGATAIR